MCNHPYLCYSSGGQQPLLLGHFNDGLVRQAGKLYTLDRMFVKLRASGHRVLVFSTMTRVLDMLQVNADDWACLPFFFLKKKMYSSKSKVHIKSHHGICILCIPSFFFSGLCDLEIWIDVLAED